MQARYAIASALVLFASGTLAHTVWLEPVAGKPNDYRVFFGGHAGELEPYQPEKLKTVDAFDAQGNELAVKRSIDADKVYLQVAGSAALIAMHFDNGIHTRAPRGPSIEKPMNEVPGATRATYAVKYHKTVTRWSPFVTKTLGQPFEVVPLDAAQPTAGRPLRVRVLQDGKPVAGVKLGRGEEGSAQDPVTDAQGIAAFVPTRGFNKLWAGKRIPVTDNPRYSELSYEYLFGFHAE